MIRARDVDLRGKRVLIREDFNVPLKGGEVTQPVRLLGGCGIYQVLKIEHTPLEEVKDDLHASLMKQRPSAVELAGFVNQLYEDSKR